MRKAILDVCRERGLMLDMKQGTIVFLLSSSVFLIATRAIDPRVDTPEEWRKEHRFIDLHQHIDCTPEHLARAIKIMDAAGIGIGVNLTAGVVTKGPDGISEFERNKKAADQLYPGRFVSYVNLDYAKWDEPDFAEQAAKQIEEGHRLGAAGFKQEKTLGLYLRDKNKKLLKIDDPKLDGVWEKCGELGMPVSIHVADPKAFWLPYDEKNERWTELKDHKNWWFGDKNVYPSHEELLAALDRVIERHPKTIFVCVHFANNAEDLDWVDQALDKRPNMYADLAARIPEIGRHDPEKVRKLFLKHQDRIFFATDFQVYNRLTLGSGGSGPAPTDDDAQVFYQKHWRWLETNDRNFPHMTPIQGDWTISGIGLPNDALRKIYFDNAEKLLTKSLPVTLWVARGDQDVSTKAALEEGFWAPAKIARLDYETANATPVPAISTVVRAIYTKEQLYLRYDAPYTELSSFEPARFNSERVGLWDRDVVEAFIGTNPANIREYYEFEVAPTNEKLDLIITPDIPKVEQRLEWNSGWESAVNLDKEKKIWTTVMRIPLQALSKEQPSPDKIWRVNLYRIDRASRSFLALRPTLTGSYHTPERFAQMIFEK
jgi:predicted TIM-barrel fold metal-dependent hydrolase